MKRVLFSLSAILLCTCAIMGQVSRNGLLAAYKFDSNYNDSSLNHRHALWANTTFVNDRNGVPNSAVNFNGEDGFVTAYIGSHSDMTVAFWCKPSSSQPQPYPHFWDYGNYSYRGMIMAGSIYNSSDRHKVYTGTNFPNETFVKSANSITYNQWQHVAFVYDKVNNKLKLFINGTLSNETTLTSSLSPQDSTIIFGRIKNGSLTNISTSSYKGAIDDIYIYNRALTTQEVSDLKDGNFSTLGVPKVPADVNPDDIVIYPNPANTQINITNTDVRFTITSIQVTDITGKVVVLSYNPSQVDISNLAQGTYIVNVMGESNTILKTEKVIKK